MRHTPTEQEWLQLRKGVITATQAPSLLGLNPFSSPMKMWKEKTESVFVGNAYTKLGQLLEPVVVSLTNEVMDAHFQLYEVGDERVFFTLEEERLGATPDAYEGDILLECKTTKPVNYLRYFCSPPLYYIMQLQVQMYCTNLTEGYLSIMSTNLTQYGPEPRWPVTIFKVKCCENLRELLYMELKRFWHCMENNKLFRVNSKVKKRAQFLCWAAFEKIGENHVR